MKINNFNFKIITFFIIFLIISCSPPKLNSSTNFKIEDGKILLTNGKVLTGKVSFPINSTERYVTINIKKRNQTVDKREIDKITYITSAGPLEFFNLPIFKRSKKIKKHKKLLALSIKGKVNLYVSQGSGYEQRGNMSVPVYFTEYYCKKDSEQAATIIHIDNGVINPNGYFRYFAKRYFADDKEIVRKIKSKEFTYKNLYEVIEYYNSK